MAIYPLIDGPCPYEDRLAEIADEGVCRMCNRQVHDLTSMSDNQRRAFLKSSRGEVCVSYRISAATAADLSALAAAAAPGALAQQPPMVPVSRSVEDVVVVRGGRIANPVDVEPLAVIHVDANRQAMPQPAVDPDPADRAYPSTAGKGAGPDARRGGTRPR